MYECQPICKYFHFPSIIDGQQMIIHSLDAYRSNAAWQHTAKLSFIENQIKICESINSPVELEQWYSILGLHLAQHGNENRIRILLDDLLGSAVTFTTNDTLKKQTILVRIIIEMRNSIA